MPPRNKDPTRAQLSSRLAYHDQTPAFLRKFKAKLSGEPDDDELFESIDDSRPAIPVRPSSPVNREHSEEEEVEEWDGAQIVVLKEGKHLDARAIENLRRKEKGLSPVHDVNNEEEAKPMQSKHRPPAPPPLSFSSKGGEVGFGELAAAVKKRKRPVVVEEDTTKKKKRKKPEKKTLLSFGDET